MFWRRREMVFAIAGYKALLVILLFSVSCYAERNKTLDCHSSCGDINNITHPFRLKTDPENCGYKGSEMSCENQRLVLYLNSGKYFVLAIDYDQETIRIVDVGIEKDNCSSLPLYSLTAYNFSSDDQEGPIYYHPYYPTASVAVFMNCEKAVMRSHSPRNNYYIDTSATSSGGNNCKYSKEDNNSSFSSVNAKGVYSYVMVGEEVVVSDVAESCTVERVRLLMSAALGEENGRSNFSYMDVHNAMASGFELRWDQWGGIENEGKWRRFLKRNKWRRFLKRARDYIPLWAGARYYIPLWAVTYVWMAIGIAARSACGMPFAFGFLIYKFRRRHLSGFDYIESFLQSDQNNLTPIRYSYSHIKTMTEGLKDKLGKGGYGSVYKGKLRSGSLVAIKLLNESKANGQEFINEVATIGRIHHINVVRLIGYCAERSKRALVYDFLPNGSLEKYIFSQEGPLLLSCKQMYEISIGVARGIEYLHRGCDMQILHFDIKPHNILLDENFTPKVSDFGLAKLYPVDDSIVSLTAARGTMGYMAPELFYKNIGGISYKADIYSFGMLLMEMAGRRRNLDAFADHTSQIYFPLWIYDQFQEGRDRELGGTTEEERVMVKKMITVALWCIQMKPSDRPSMSKVVEMLEGNVELLQMPPKPVLYPQEMPTEVHENSTNPVESPNSIIVDISAP